MTLPITLDDIKKKIANEPTKTILTANGFNLHIGLKTSYPTIVKAMLADEPQFKFKAVFKKHQYNVEAVMDTINANEDFVKYYATKAIKRDFIKALVQIVKEFDKNNKEGTDKADKILNGFDNFFTLNFDTFLYRRLLKNAKATFSIEDYKDQDQRDFYYYLKERLTEETIITIKNEAGWDEDQLFNELPKKTQESIVREFIPAEFKNGDKLKDGLGKVLEDKIHKQERETVDNNLLNHLDDAFLKHLYHDSRIEKANLYFLHGALHLYEDDNEKKKQKSLIKTTNKITASQEKKLIDEIDEHWNDDQMLCLLKGDNKKKYVADHAYLADCSLRLSHLNGALVAIGVGFADNDLYLLEAINQSEITKLYIFDFNEDFLKETPSRREIIKDKLSNKKIEIIFFSTL